MIYLDNAATTRVYERANRILFESGDKFYFNASTRPRCTPRRRKRTGR